MTKLRTACPKCGISLRGVTNKMVGDIGVCPKCRAEFEIKGEKDILDATPSPGEAPVDATLVGGPSAGTQLVVILAILLSAFFIAIYGLLLYGTVSLLFKSMAKVRLPAAKNWVLWELIASAFIVLVLFAIGGNMLFGIQPGLKPAPRMAPPVFIAVCAVFYVAFSILESVFAAIQLGHYRRVHFAGNPNHRRCLLKAVFLGFFLTNFILILLAVPLAIVVVMVVSGEVRR